MKTKVLVNGKIPAHTVCPFESRCMAACVGNCHHNGSDHPIPYSCATARVFELTDKNAMKSKMEIFEEVAKKHLFVDTLETRNSDRLDFKEVHVRSLIDAFEEIWNEAQK